MPLKELRLLGSSSASVAILTNVIQPDSNLGCIHFFQAVAQSSSFAELQSGIHSSSRGPFTGHFKYVIMHRVYDDMLPSLYDRTNTEALTFKLISWMHKLSIVLNDKSRSKQVVMFSSLLRSWILSLCDWLHSRWSAVVSGKLYSIRCLTPAPVCCRIPSLRY